MILQHTVSYCPSVFNAVDSRITASKLHEGTRYVWNRGICWASAVLETRHGKAGPTTQSTSTCYTSKSEIRKCKIG